VKDEIPPQSLGNEVGMDAEALKRAEQTPLAALGLEFALNAPLTEVGVERVSELARVSREDLLDVFGLGPRRVDQIAEALGHWVASNQGAGRARSDAAECERPETEAGTGRQVQKRGRPGLPRKLGVLGRFPSANPDGPLVKSGVNRSVGARPIEVLGLSARSHNCLRGSGVDRLGQLAQMTPRELLAMWSLGRGSLKEIVTRLGEYLEDRTQPVARRIRSVSQKRLTGVRSVETSGALDEEESLLGVALMSEPVEARAAGLDHGECIADLGLAPDSIAGLGRLCIDKQDSVEVIGCSSLGYLGQELRAEQLDEVIQAWFSRVAPGQQGTFAARVESYAAKATLLRTEKYHDVEDGASRLRARLLTRPIALLGLSEETEGALEAVGTVAIGELAAAFEKDLLRELGTIGKTAAAIAEVRGALDRFFDKTRSVGEALCYAARSLGEFLSAHVKACLGTEVSERNHAICRRRWGIDGDGGSRRRRPTLEEVGSEFGLTRERVRQVAARGEKALKGSASARRRKPLVRRLEDILAECLGVCSLSHLGAQLQRRYCWETTPRRREVLFLLRFARDCNVGPRWQVVHRRRCKGLETAVRRTAVELIRETGEGRSLLNFQYDLSNALRGTCWGERRENPLRHCGLANEGGQGVLPRTYLEAVLSDTVPAILDGEEVLPPDQWMVRRGRKRVAVVEAALRVIGHPVHYSEVAAYLRERSSRFPRVTADEIHTTVTAYPQFVSVARGMYGLWEWDVERELTAGDAIERLLREKGQALPLSRIVWMLEEQGYGEMNVRAALGQQRFVDMGGYVYDLRARWEQSRCRKGELVVGKRRKRRPAIGL